MKGNKLEIGDVIYTTGDFSRVLKKNIVNRLTPTQAHCDTGLKFKIEIDWSDINGFFRVYKIGDGYSGTLANEKLDERFELQKKKRQVAHNLQTIQTWDLTMEECDEINAVFDKLQTAREAKINSQENIEQGI